MFLALPPQTGSTDCIEEKWLFQQARAGLVNPAPLFFSAPLRGKVTCQEIVEKLHFPFFFVKMRGRHNQKSSRTIALRHKGECGESKEQYVSLSIDLGESRP